MESTEEYKALEWQDKSCLKPFEEPNVDLASRLCYACRGLFSGSKEFQKPYKHYYYLSSLRSTADRGCHLCILIRSKIDRETQNHRLSEVLRLFAEIYPSSMKQESNAFELWFHFFRIPKRVGYGDIVWAIKRMNFLPVEGWSFCTFGTILSFFLSFFLSFRFSIQDSNPSCFLRLRSGGYQWPSGQVEFAVSGKLLSCEPMAFDLYDKA